MLNWKEDLRPTKFTCNPPIASLDSLTALRSDSRSAGFLFPNHKKALTSPAPLVKGG